jgi:GDP-L-fucose synthase
MRVLVTGGFGFVGRWFVAELLRTGADVHVVDNLQPGSGAINPGTSWLGGDPTKRKGFTFETSDCREFFSRDNSKWDLVIHLAAVVGGRLTIERNPLAVAQDLSIDAEFWGWAVRSMPGKIIHFSSSAAYPVKLQTASSYRRLRESDIDFSEGLSAPNLTYGWAKLTSEYLATFATTQYGLSVFNFRPFSGYGEDQDLSYPFPAIVKRAVDAKNSDKAGEPFIVWGSGMQERDFIHISDIVRLCMLAVVERESIDSLNLGTGQATNFLALANKAIYQAGLESQVQGQEQMPEGVFSRCADVSKLESMLGSSSVSLDEGILRAIDFYRTRPNVFQ